MGRDRGVRAGARVAMHLDDAVDEVDDPVVFDAALGVDAGLRAASLRRLELAISMTSQASLGCARAYERRATTAMSGSGWE